MTLLVLGYHRTIQKGIVLFGEDWKKVDKVHLGNNRPLSITTVSSKFVVKYQPDVYFKLKNGKILIFEILQTELKKQDIIIADVIRSFLVENVCGLVFIYKTKKKKDEDRILEALTTIYGGLIDKEMPAKELPTWSRKGQNGKFLTGPISIKPSEFKNAEKVKKILQKVAKKEKW